MDRLSRAEIIDRKVTLERMLQQQRHPLFLRLPSLWFDVYKYPDAWTFPAEEGGVSGFAGLAPIFVVGEHPSLSGWPPNDKGRRLLYDSLVACGAADAHITDIIKSRIKAHEWKEWAPERFRPHVEFLHREMDELKAEKLILLGNDAQTLFSTYFKQCALPVRTVLHFGALRWVPSESRSAWCRSFRETLSTALSR
jgi:hypothetical protein